MKNPKFSIITVCKNEKKLEKTCKSVCSQTFRDFEWIVIDGGSNKETLEIFEKYKSKINYFVSEEDAGIYNAMNKGIKASSGDYLIFMNAGDTFYSPFVLQNVVNEEILSDVVYGDTFKTDTGKVKVHPDNLTSNFWIGDTINHQAVFIKRKIYELYGGYDESLKIAADSKKLIELLYIKKLSYEHINHIIAKYDSTGLSSALQAKDLLIKEKEAIVKELFDPKEILKVKAQKQLINRAKNFVKKIRNYILKRISENLRAENRCLKRENEILKRKNRKLKIESNKLKFLQTENPSRIPVFMASDDNYAPFLCASMRSILENTSSLIEFNILDNGITEEKKNKILKSLEEFKNKEITFFDMAKFSSLQEFPDLRHYTKTTFCRYFIPDLCKNHKKVLYFDVDTIIKGDILELFNQDLDGYPIGAILEDFYPANYTVLKEKIFPEFNGGDKYFNAGILVIDLEKFKKENCQKKLIELTIQLNDRLSCADQDVFNIVFENNFKILDYKFNFMPDHKHFLFEKHPDISVEPVILHYAAGKPWKMRSSRNNDFWEILNDTEFYEEVQAKFNAGGKF